MLNAPINSGHAGIFEFGPFSPTWGMLLCFVILLVVADIVMGMRHSGNGITRGNALRLFPKSVLVCFGTTAVCLILSWCLMLVIIFFVGILMKLTGGLRPAPLLKAVFSWLCLGGSLYLSYLIIANRRRGPTF
jgi:hypothetical protein